MNRAVCTVAVMPRLLAVALGCLLAVATVTLQEHGSPAGSPSRVIAASAPGTARLFGENSSSDLPPRASRSFVRSPIKHVHHHLPATPATPAGPRYSVRISPRTAVSSVTVESTSYCLTGTMADGQPVHWGAAAMNGVPLGTRYYSPTLGRTFTVEDRIGWGTQFDIWTPSCADADTYGRRTIVLQRLG